MKRSSIDIAWTVGEIAGCEVRDLTSIEDERGWLLEFFRTDQLDDHLRPEMGYVSLTHPGVARGPHEHRDQSDLFVFFHGAMRLYMWDARSESKTYGRKAVYDFGEDRPASVVVPPGVVHGYRNIGATPALIINCPNRLYGGRGKAEPVDEIRHEDDEASPFKLA